MRTTKERTKGAALLLVSLAKHVNMSKVMSLFPLNAALSRGTHKRNDTWHAKCSLAVLYRRPVGIRETNGGGAARN
jgi:hypothetical protein